MNRARRHELPGLRPLAIGAVALAVACVSSCGDSGGAVETPDDRANPDAPVFDNDLAGRIGHPDLGRPEVRPPFSGCRAPSPPAPPGVIELTPVWPELFGADVGLERPIHLEQAPDDASQWYLATLGGLIVRFDESDPAGSVEVALDVSARLSDNRFEAGLFSFALHPDLLDNGYVFVTYTTRLDGPLRSYLSRFRLPDGGGGDPLDDEVVLLELDQPNGLHNGNHVAFGPDGYLYYALGDGGGISDPAQDPHDLYGTIVRLDIDGEDNRRGLAYAIPPDNPFVDGSGAPEVWAYGFRNPWRFSVDPVTGDVWAGDVGAESREEVNFVVPGGNYGWPVMEGSLCRGPDPSRPLPPEDCAGREFVDPVLEYSHSQGSSVTGGVVYRGGEIPELEGLYIWADWVNGSLWVLDESGDAPAARLELESGLNVASWAQSRDGTVYLLDMNYDRPGGLLRLDPAPEPVVEQEAFPRFLSGTGCVDPDDPRHPSSMMVFYQPRVQLWSDGAAKERYLFVPRGEVVDVTGEGDFELPLGSVLVKHFEFGGVYHETRLLMLHESGWAGYSYLWNAEQTDAELLDTGLTQRLDNGVQWTYPTRAQCMRCHTRASGRSLGLEVAQLDFPEGARNQLQQLVDDGLFGPGVVESRDLPGYEAGSLVDPFDERPGEDGELSLRARSYLHANCSMCHRPGGPTPLGFDMRFTTPLDETGMCDAPPASIMGKMTVPGEEQRIIAPGRSEASVLPYRVRVSEATRMPPLGTDIPHEDAVLLLERWIDDLESCDGDEP